MTLRLNSFLSPLLFSHFSWRYRSRGCMPLQPPTGQFSIPVQITHAQNFDPFPSPDGKKLVFISMLSGKEQLFTMDVDGSNILQLTRDDADHEDPAWSPDGRKIAFASNRRGHGYQIFVMDADGANPRLVANTEGRGTALRWSPDGKTIYFTNCLAKDYGADCEILAARL